ncbi:hypothetical protein [Lentzea sp. NPDC004782]|uniref:hypothetical protein n=1 Tax=Lentzea sp. NPDC004782 TaxID=3154458 RepID=UPI0033AABAA9
MKLKTVLAAMTAAFTPIIGLVTPALADGPCWGNGDEMVDSACGRDTYIIDPGVHTELTPQNIQDVASHYHGREFDPNFIWYTQSTT